MAGWLSQPQTGPTSRKSFISRYFNSPSGGLVNSRLWTTRLLQRIRSSVALHQLDDALRMRGFSSSTQPVASMVSLHAYSGQTFQPICCVVPTEPCTPPVQINSQDKIVEGVSITGLGAFQLQWGLVQDAGLNLMADPAEVRLAYNQKKVGQ